ncbi:MAG TPA: hypothetical protein VHV32_19200 [Candidatus Angelobacter sp.]|jgi:hypothetical protein|nr:hypothetical protein [Candidatus Angelobacter sp.]
MAVTEQFSCDTCGKLKQTTNHWFLAVWDGAAITVRHWTSVQESNRHGFKHYCGQECVIKAVNEWMQSE